MLPAEPRLRHSPRCAGFALLIAIALLSFAFLVLVALAVHTRIELSAAGSAQGQAQARAIALVALDVALGELQTSAGPDQRVTATGEAFEHAAGTEHYTGVWDAAAATNAPLIWLVSGNEGGAAGAPGQPLAVSPAVPGLPLVELVGRRVMGAEPDHDGRIMAPLCDLNATGVSGNPTDERLGRYAWWVGDEGVKADLATDPFCGRIAYAPYNSNEGRARLRQQVSCGAAPEDLEPWDSHNGMRMGSVIARNQIAFLHATDGFLIGANRIRQNFHSWTAGSLAVLADTKLGGLRRDLSLAPELLGDAVAAWTDWQSHVEPPVPGGPAAPAPGYGDDPLRRRHRIMPPATGGGFAFTTAPVLTLFFLQFNVRRVGGNSTPAATRELEVRARMVCQLWNPWTAALVPEDLRLEVSGLPVVTVSDSRGGVQPLNLQALFGLPHMAIRLTAADVAFPGDPDDRSWLPGRVYYWRTKGGDRDEWGTEFYNRTLAIPNPGTWTVPTGIAYLPPAANSVTLRISGPASRLILYLRRASDDALLATYRSPEFEPFATEPRPVGSNDEYRIGFPIRMVESTDLAAATAGEGWLQGFGTDPRALVVTEPMLRSLSAGTRPEQYVGVGGSAVFTDPDRLFDRVMGKSGMSYNEDVPVFELPRAPVLSLGELQHLQVEGGRPFALGNGWGGSVAWKGTSLNAIFDRYFVSGLARGVGEPEPEFGTPLPVPGLKVLRIPGAARATTAQDLRAEAGFGFSSKHLLQAGAFNLNSVKPASWRALLRSARALPGEQFRILDSSPINGTAGDADVAEVPLAGAMFFRFPQSAQETYKAEPGYAASTAVPPSLPAIGSAANTHVFRRGVRVLSPGEVGTLAEAIVERLRRKQTSSGPYRCMEEFLNASALFADGAGRPRSLLEAAIAAAALNDAVPEFSSQFLTPADLMARLAPQLFARSDTFVIRAYGEAVNPATGAAEGRAWCEATVQRTPAYFDASQPPETAVEDLNELNRALGRRFKTISFRWLTRSEI